MIYRDVDQKLDDNVIIACEKRAKSGKTSLCIGHFWHENSLTKAQQRHYNTRSLLLVFKQFDYAQWEDDNRAEIYLWISILSSIAAVILVVAVVVTLISRRRARALVQLTESREQAVISVNKLSKQCISLQIELMRGGFKTVLSVPGERMRCVRRCENKTPF